MVEEVFSERAPRPVGPYSQAVRAGGFVFVSGQIPIDPEMGALVKGGIERQAEQALKNLREVLRAAGLTMRDVVKVTVYLANMEDFARFNEVYSRFFEKPYPARSVIEASRLPRNALVEIEAIARCREQRPG